MKAAANQADEAVQSSFNINDGSFGAVPDERERPDPATAGRKSPALSVISTASSASPLIRNNSAASFGDQAKWQRSAASNQQQVGASPLRRPAPTSIAAAQLQQQQHQSGQLPDKTLSGRAPTKQQQHGNKLAQMARLAPVGQRAEQTPEQRPKGSLFGAPNQHQQRAGEKPKKKPSDEQAKSFGYTLGKTLAGRTNR